MSVSTPITITCNQLLQWTLQRQGLITRHEDLCTNQFGPLHSTNQSTTFLSLLARCTPFIDRSSELWEQAEYDDRREFVRLRCMRGTLHLIPKDAWQIVRRVYSVEAIRKFENLSGEKIDHSSVQAIKDRICATLSQHGPMAAFQLKKALLGKKKTLFTNFSAKDESRLEHAGVRYLLDCLSNQGALHYGSGTAKMAAKRKIVRKKDNTESANSTVPADNATPNAAITAAQARTVWRKTNRNWSICTTKELTAPPNTEQEITSAIYDLIEWYFMLYGPATLNDVLWWTGLPTVGVRAAFRALSTHLTEVRVPNWTSLFILNSQVEALQASPDQPVVMARLLPYEDALIKAYKETRSRFFGFQGPDKSVAFSKVISSDGVACPSVWIDGEIVGKLEWKNKEHQPILVTLFRTLTDCQSALLHTECEIIKKFMVASDLKIETQFPEVDSESVNSSDDSSEESDLDTH